MIRMMLLQQLHSQDLPPKILVKNKAIFQGKEMMKISLNPVRLMKKVLKYPPPLAVNTVSCFSFSIFFFQFLNFEIKYW